MVTQVSVGFPLHRLALMGIAFRDIYPKVGRDSFHAFPLREVTVLLSFFGVIVGVGGTLKRAFP